MSNKLSGIPRIGRSETRADARLRYRLGCERDGSFRALEVSADFDTGACDHLGGVVLALGLEHAGGAFRGFGVPQVAAAMEQMVDLAAAECGLSPLEIRRRNILDRGGAQSAWSY
ncbi:MAG: molybdopterin-dependent oxidoreductase, partial [Deltaproteobacteria bacterium]|nr:molybdopterin-dependent oxidoreductase [Deltaproteobacteria bacterium]